MRTDRNVARLSFRHSDQWRTDPFANVRAPEIDRRLKGAEMVNGRLVVHSLSGHERNHLFLNRKGRTFEDNSLISGLDNPADSRCFVTLDYDRDGQLDIALVNANTPLLNLYRNQLERSFAGADGKNKFMAIRFVGANHQAQPSGSSTRDGFGAIVEFTIDGAKLKREHRCGEGYGGQNSTTMIVGLGAATAVDKVEVRWPSGVQTQLEHLPAGSLVTAFEDPQHNADGATFDVQRYMPASDRAAPAAKVGKASPSLTISSNRSLPPESPSQAKLNVYVTMATWCTACLEHAPHLRRIRSEFADDELQLVGLPIDPEEGPDQLIRYSESVDPPYHRLLLLLTPSERAAIQSVLATVNPPDAVPATIVTDAEGQVLYAAAGTPTISQLRKLLAPK